MPLIPLAAGTVRQEQQQQQSNRFLTRGKQTNRVSVLRGLGLGSSISLSSHEQRKVVIDEHKNSGIAAPLFFVVLFLQFFKKRNSIVPQIFVFKGLLKLIFIYPLGSFPRLVNNNLDCKISDRETAQSPSASLHDQYNSSSIPDSTRNFFGREIISTSCGS